MSVKGLRKRPTYEELIDHVDNIDEIVKKYPDRRALFMRNHPYLTQLDGENFLEAMSLQQENIIKSQQQDLAIRQYAMLNKDSQTSHLETLANAQTQIPEHYQIHSAPPSPRSSPKLPPPPKPKPGEPVHEWHPPPYKLGGTPSPGSIISSKWSPSPPPPKPGGEPPPSTPPPKIGGKSIFPPSPYATPDSSGEISGKKNADTKNTLKS